MSFKLRLKGLEHCIINIVYSYKKSRDGLKNRDKLFSSNHMFIVFMFHQLKRLSVYYSATP